MSPSARSSLSCGPVVACKTGRDNIFSAGSDGKLDLGIRKKQGENYGSSSPALKVSKEGLHRVRKPPLPLPQVQYRPPIIIHTHSPKVLHTEPDHFMSLVQKLTGSSDTRLRLKLSKTKKPSSTSSSKKAENPKSCEEAIGGATIQRQGSGSSSATSKCGSPSSSGDSAGTFLVADNNIPDRSVAGELVATMKQSNSPRSPFDSDFEFENHDNNNNLQSMFSHLEGPTMFSQVKAEPFFNSFTENNINASPGFNQLFADFMMHPGAQAQANYNSKLLQPMISPKVSQGPQMHPQDGIMGAYIDINSHLPGYLSPHLGLPDLSPGNWSQSNYLDCLTGQTATHYINPGAPYLRQRQFCGGHYPASPEATVQALENIHSNFTLT